MAITTASAQTVSRPPRLSSNRITPWQTPSRIKAEWKQLQSLRVMRPAASYRLVSMTRAETICLPVEEPQKQVRLWDCPPKARRAGRPASSSVNTVPMLSR